MSSQKRIIRLIDKNDLFHDFHVGEYMKKDFMSQWNFDYTRKGCGGDNGERDLYESAVFP